MKIKINFNRERTSKTNRVSEFYNVVQELCYERKKSIYALAEELGEEYNAFKQSLNKSTQTTDFIQKVVKQIDPKLKVEINLETSELKIK